MKEKMIEWLQSQINEVKFHKENGNEDMANTYMEVFNNGRMMYEYATGEKVTIKAWVVSAE